MELARRVLPSKLRPHRVSLPSSARCPGHGHVRPRRGGGAEVAEVVLVAELEGGDLGLPLADLLRIRLGAEMVSLGLWVVQVAELAGDDP
eukprot:5961664-Pyramimonas_sp.AAC.1